MSVLAVVPARGGSKGLPRKNVLLLAGLPLVGHALECARRCPSIARTVVSTEDAEVAEVVQSLGGEVVRRPDELAQDTTPTWPVLQHVLAALDPEAREFETLVLLEPTDPLRLPEDVEGAVALLRSRGDVDGVVSVSEPSFNPIWQGVTVDDGVLRPLWSGTAYERRQDVPQGFYINGCVYAWRAAFVRGHSDHWLEGRFAPYVTPAQRSVSIDSADDLALCELYLSAGRAALPWVTPRRTPG